MKRLAIFAHYDGHDEVKGFVLHHLQQLREHCDRIDFVSTARLPGHELAKAGRFCERTLVKENTGFDFGMWRHALEEIEPRDWDELVLTNSSVIGPIYPLREMFDDMRDRPVDFWGATDNFDIEWHIQSYFLVFRKSVLSSPAFAAFWKTVLPYRRKGQVIRSYEVGLSSWLKDEGFTGRAFIPAESLFPPWPLNKLIRRNRLDPTICHPMRVLKRRMPYVKTNLLRDNPVDVPLKPVWDTLRASGYDLSLVQHDRAPRPRGWQRVVHRARQLLE